MSKKILAPYQIILPEALFDIVNCIQIRSNSCFGHPQYPPLEISPEILSRFTQLPPILQQKYSSLQLRNYLYSIYFTGNCRRNSNNEEDIGLLNRSLQNNTARGMNLEFYHNLQASNSGTGFFDPGWQIIGAESDTGWIVRKNGLTLHINPLEHLRVMDKSDAIDDIVAIRLPNSRLEAGYYVAVGNAGGVEEQSVDRPNPNVEIYLNVSSAGAVALMSTITAPLNEMALPFTFKTWIDPSEYERYDTAVLTCKSLDYAVIQPLLQRVYRQYQEYFRNSIPIFTKFLAPGIGLVTWSAIDTCFGLDRCQLVADGLLAAKRQSQRFPDQRLAAICQQFAQAGIDWQQPYLSAQAIDIYNPLNL
jgi:hypothetical protein